MNNWPYPDKPGVPLNPEKDGWHFVERQKEITAIEWISGEWWTGGLGIYGGGYYNSEYIGLNYTYLGPCLTPSKASRLRDIVATLLSVMPAFPAAAKCIVGMEDRYNAAIEQARAFLVADEKDD